MGLPCLLSTIAIDSGFVSTGLGQTASFAASDEQNYPILPYKYHCLLMSSTLSVITSGSFPAVGCTFPLSTFTEKGLP